MKHFLIALTFSALMAALVTVLDNQPRAAAVTVIEQADPPAEVTMDRLPKEEWAQPSPNWEIEVREMYKRHSI